MAWSFGRRRPTTYLLGEPVDPYPAQAPEAARGRVLRITEIGEPLERPGAATVRGVDQHGGPVQLSGRGFLARAFIHETQHLDGTLYWDHLSPEVQADALRQRDENRANILVGRREIAI